MSQIWSTHCSTLSEKSHSYGLRYLFNSTLWKQFLGENSAGFLQKKHKPKTTQPIHAHSVWTKPYCSTASNEGSISQIATFEVIRKFFHTSIDVHNWAQPAAKALSSIYHLEAWRLSLIGEGGESVRKALSAEETDTGFMNGGRSHISPVRGVKLRRLTPHTGLSL